MNAQTLPDADWRRRPGLDGLLNALGAAEGGARFVGGAVRDTLVGIAVQDIDVATPLTPQDVVARLKKAGIKAVPTGIDHGTITAVVEGSPVEVTTLRRDVSTDGRRATVAYTKDWREDAARRDFTINALYADPLSGAIHDYFGGVDDLAAGRVRFIGSATARIAEDHLRILRYFRFLARFGKGAPDAEAHAACVAGANSLMALSRERIADELLKLLALPDPTDAVRMMIDGDILKPVIPEIDAAGVARLAQLVVREAATGIARAPARRLAALLPPDATAGDRVGARLKLSNKMRKRVAAALTPPPPGMSLHEQAYRLGLETALDHALLAGAPEIEAVALADWRPPALPVRGATLIARGFTPGPDIAAALHAIEDEWVRRGFPQDGEIDAIVDQTVSKFQRARQ